MGHLRGDRGRAPGWHRHESAGRLEEKPPPGTPSRAAWPRQRSTVFSKPPTSQGCWRPTRAARDRPAWHCLRRCRWLCWTCWQRPWGDLTPSAPLLPPAGRAIQHVKPSESVPGHPLRPVWNLPGGAQPFRPAYTAPVPALPMASGIRDCATARPAQPARPPNPGGFVVSGAGSGVAAHDGPAKPSHQGGPAAPIRTPPRTRRPPTPRPPEALP